jgi:hypothetical protein
MLRASLFFSAFSLADALVPTSVHAAGVTATEARDAPASPPPSSCVTFQGRVRYSLGYDHLVDVQNGCTQAVTCAVTTNVNPEPINVSLEPTASTTVVTFIGSPAREFDPRVVCQYIP